MAVVEENDAFVLTETRLTRLHGGDGKGDHGEATDELGNAFSWWRTRTTMAMLGREWWTAVDSALRAEKARGKRMGQAVRSGRHWPSSGARTRDVEALAAHERHAANSFCVGRPWRH